MRGVETEIPDLDGDYVYGKVLPNLYETPGQLEDCWNEFTISDSKQLQIQGGPVWMNHQDQVEDVGHVVGFEIVKASADNPTLDIKKGDVHGNVLLKLNSNRDDFFAKFARNSLANGYYRGLSLQHEYAIKPREKRVEKKPIEVSLCHEGMRPGSTIDAYFPSRQTLQKLDGEHLKMLCKQYNYLGGSNLDGLVRASATVDDYDGVTTTPAYIDQIHHEVSLKRSQFLRRFGKTRTGIVAMSADQQTETPNEQAQQQPEKESGNEKISSQVPESLASSSSGNDDSKKRKADNLTVTEDDVRNLPEHMAEKFAQMREREAELEAKFQEAQKRARLYDQVEQENQEKERKKAMSIVASLTSLLQEDPSLDVNNTRSELKDAESLLKTDPGAVVRRFEPELRMARACSNRMKEAADRANQATQAAWERANNQKVQDWTRRINQPFYKNTSNWSPEPLTQFSAAAGAPNLTGTVSASNDHFSASSISSPMDVDVNKLPVDTPSLGFHPDFPPVSGTVCASADKPQSDTRIESDQKSKFWANEAYQRSRMAGVEPTYEQVAFGGVCAVRTGKVKASNDGSRVAETRKEYAFGKGMSFGIHEWNPELVDYMENRLDIHKTGFSMKDFSTYQKTMADRFRKVGGY